MFSENAIGERCWRWEGSVYRSPYPQKEMASGDGWSLHMRRKGPTWTNYCLYTRKVRSRSAWHLSIGRGVFAKTSEFKIMNERNPHVLRWLMDFHNGRKSEFPSDWMYEEQPTKKATRKRRERTQMDAFPPDRRKMFQALINAQSIGCALKFSERGLGIFDFLDAKTMAERNIARDFLDEMVAADALAITPNGYKIIESDPEKIADRLYNYGFGNRKRRQYGRRVN